MPQLRKDPIVGRWVIIATERARRPGNFLDQDRNSFEDAKSCPFCDNQEEEVFSVREAPHSGWQVKVVPNGTPLLSNGQKFKRKGHGIYDVINGYGANEVIIETPQHIANMADLDAPQIEKVINAYVARYKDLEQDPRIHYILIYKNYGVAAGSRPIGHARSQIIASPVNPQRVKEKLVGTKRYYDYHERCLYCDMIQQELEHKERIVAQSDHFLAIVPFASRFPFEITILPRDHHCDFAYGISGKEGDLALILKDILSRFKAGLEDPAYNFVIQTAPLRSKKSGPKWRTIEEDYHWHIELIPRLARAAGFEKGSGFYICAIPPELTAEFLRGVEI